LKKAKVEQASGSSTCRGDGECESFDRGHWVQAKPFISVQMLFQSIFEVIDYHLFITIHSPKVKRIVHFQPPKYTMESHSLLSASKVYYGKP